VICNDEDTDGRAWVTTDEERDLHVEHMIRAEYPYSFYTHVDRVYIIDRCLQVCPTKSSVNGVCQHQQPTTYCRFMYLS